MGQPRASRRKAVVISPDEDEASEKQESPSDGSGDDKPLKPQKRSNGKLKLVKKTAKPQQSTPAPSTQYRSPQISPAKQKITKTKGRTAVKDQPANGRPIYSFFNAATSRQQASQPSASPEKRPVIKDEPDAIHDDSDEASGPIVEPSKGSSIALAMRKRKLGRTESFETDSTLPPPASQKFRKASSGERVPTLPVFNEDKRPWTNQFAPKDLSELAVHKGKVTDVHKWLEMTLKGRRQKILVLKGAAGTGKTAALRLLSQEMNLKIVAWKNPAVSDQTSEGGTSSATQFHEFVGRAGRAGGLQLTNDESESGATAIDDKVSSGAESRLLLVEEFPSTFSRTSSTLQSFRSTLLQYLASPTLVEARPTPVVMIISETLLSTNTALADSFTAHRLLGPELINHPFLDTIEFNPVARTILTKALEAVVLKEARKSGRRKTPGPQVIKKLAESGDIRSAISSLEFLCLRGDDGEAWSSKVNFTKQKKGKTEPPMTKYEADSLKLISNRESTLGIFHAVGKVMYNKRQAATPSEPIAQPPPWLPQHRRKNIWENDVDEVLNELGTDVSTFVAALHENYALSCGTSSTEDSLNSLLGCVDSISDADLLSVDCFSHGPRAFSTSATDSLRQDEMAFQTAVRGLLFSFPYPVTRMALPGAKRGEERQMFYPTSLKLWRKREEIEGNLELLTSRYQAVGVAGPGDDNDKVPTEPSAVESSKQSGTLNVEDSGIASNELPITSRSSSAKMEMLTERLPYMAQILSSKPNPPRLLGTITSVTRIRDNGVSATDEVDDEDEEGGDAVLEQWATDQPETEGREKGKRSKIGLKKGQTKGTEGGGLAIPVESLVEKLVLEDDDIVDD